MAKLSEKAKVLLLESTVMTNDAEAVRALLPYGIKAAIRRFFIP